MKNKPQRHKTANKFKFQSFAERISNVNVDVFHRVSHENEEPEEGEEAPSYFYQSLRKWDDLNYSESYKRIRKDLPDSLKSSSEVQAQKEHVVSVLLASLKNSDPYSLQSTLELVVALAQDLGKEFYSFYFDVFNLLLNLLNCHDADQLEWTFTCLAYLLKILWRVLLINIVVVFKSLLPLLSSSKPWYINNFAADTFAFVARKVKDKKSFLKLILDNLDNNRDKIAGCGRLLFAIVKSVLGNFHTCANHYLPFFFESLADEELPHELLFKIYTEMIEHIIKSISPKKCELLWIVLLGTLNKFIELWMKNNSERCESNICQILSLILQVLEFRNAASLSNPNLLADSVLKLLDLELSTPINQLILKVTSTLLKAQGVQLSQECAAKLSSKVFSKFDFEFLVEYIKLMLDYANFDALILPATLDFVKKFKNEELNLKMVNLLAEIVVFKTPCFKSSLEFSNFQVYSLIDSHQRNGNRLGICNACIDYLSALKSYEEVSMKFEDVLSILIVLPHFKNAPNSNRRASVVLKIHNYIVEALTNIVDFESEISQSFILKMFHIWNYALLAIFQIIEAKEEFSKNTSCDIVNTLLKFIAKEFCKLNALRILDFFIAAAPVVTSDVKLCAKVEQELIKHLASPFHAIRLLTTNILVSCFRGKSDDKIATNKLQIYQIMLKAENIEATITTYRDKLMLLQRLEYSPKLQELLNNSISAPLNYLFGMLFINFKLIWEPVNNFVTAYASASPIDKFWPIYKNQLVHNADFYKNQSKIVPSNVLNFQSNFQENLYAKLNTMEEKPDFFNYQCLLLENLKNFITVRMVKNDEIYLLFLSFMNNEYHVVNPDVAKTWNIKQNNDPKVIENEALEEKDENVEESSDLVKEATLSAKKFNRLLVAYLKIVCMPHSKKQAKLESKLLSVYEDLLMHRSCDIQKLAFDCIAAYKLEYLTPYLENIYRLIDDKTFKSELVSFRVDSSSDVISPVHRPKLMPFILRILYSKMLNSKKVGSQMRRTTVLRYLAGCNSAELEIFIEMSFKLFIPSIQTYSEVYPMTCDIISSTDLENAIPPKRLLSSISLATVILTQSGGLMDEKSLRLLLKVIMVIGAHMTGIFIRRQNVHSGYFNILNKIKNSSIDLITEFFKRFETYNWTVDEINAVFNVFVWSWLRRINFEGIFSPTPLFKLFSCWSENPRYFSLLAKPTQKDNVTPLDMLMKLLLNEKTHGSVCNGILEIIERLLTLKDFKSKPDQDNEEEPVEVSPIPIDFEPTMPENVKLRRKLNLGSCLLYPHLHSILKKLQNRLFISQKKTLSSRDLLILSRVTEITDGNELADSLLSLIVPVLLNKSTQSEEIIYPLLMTALNLLKSVKIEKLFLRKFAVLFHNISHISCRKLLLNLIKTVLTKIDDQDVLDIDVLNDLNAYDPKWVEQPDFDKRLNAFNQIEEKINNGSISAEFGVILIYNFFYFVNNESDMALRDRSSFCLKKLSVELCSKFKGQDLNFIANQTIIPIIQKSLKDVKNEKMYLESINLLGCLTRECPDAHFVFSNFSPLVNKLDLEVDFFENLTHLQLHRKVRALLKFSEKCQEMKKPPHLQTLINFSLPIVSQFLCNPDHQGHNTIVDAAVEALGNICRLLPWQQYFAILQFYLSKLKRLIEFQKQLVKIVKKILDAFHFDLSRAAEVKIRANGKIIKQKEEKSNVDNREVNESELGEDMELIDERIEGGGEDEDNDVKSTENEKTKEAEEDSGETVSEAKDADLEKLEKDLAVDTTEITESFDDKSESEFVINRISVLEPNQANRVIHSILSGLLPQLRNTIAERSLGEKYHKLNKKYTGMDKDEEDILRIPLALTIVQLLQKLPEKFLKTNISGIFIKLCMFLQSRLESVRRVTRQTLQQIILTLGPAYLEILIKEMITLLTKGFHVYVLVHTLHSVLDAVKPLLKEGDLDRCLPLILKVCVEDLFGSIAEGKESAPQITGKWVEARGNRSYDVFHILGEYVSQKCLLNLILPLKEELSSTFTHTRIFRVQECLRYTVLGLVNNQFLSTESMCIFALGVTSQSIPALIKGMEPESSVDDKEKVLLERRNPDCFIIPLAPKERPKVETHIYVKTNAHILVEFGLRLYYFLLKKEKVKDVSFHPHLDLLVPLLSDCLKSDKVKLVTLACKCLSWVFKMDLPNLREKIGVIAEQLFSLLHKYAAAGLSKGDNFELVQTSFKAVSVLVRDVNYHKITQDQLRTLLLYAEQDLNDYSRQATAFTLLKVIISKKLTAPEIHAVMEKVATLSISADLPHVRLQARQVFHSFLMNYPLRKKIEGHLTFYLKQLDFDYQTGRESALEMMNVVISTFPESMLTLYCGLFFLWLGPRLVNDPAPECRKMAAACILRMLARLDKENVDKLFEMVLVWMKHHKISYRRLSVQLCGLFIKHEKTDFKSRIPTLLPIICSHFMDNFDDQPGRFVRVQKHVKKPEPSEDDDSMKDHHLYQLLHMLVQLCSECKDIFTEPDFKESLQALAAKAQELLGHPHEWVRLGAAEFLHCMMSANSPEDISELANIPADDLEYSPGFLRSNIRDSLKSLILDHIDQLVPGAQILDKLLIQTMKNLIFLAEIVKNVKDIEGEIKVSLIWVVRKLRQRINMELSRAPLNTTIRTMVFNWLAALALKFNKEELRPIIFHALAPIVRELTTTEAHLEELRKIAKEVSGYYKQKYGSQEYSQLVLKVQQRLDIKRAERKKSRVQEVVKNPEKAAKRKINKQLKKKDQKKRKIEQLRSGVRKRKISSTELDD